MMGYQMGYQRNYVGGFVGYAGAGKSVSLAEVCAVEMIKGRRVWSNLPVEIKKGTAIYNRKEYYGIPIKEVKTEPLDMNLIYLMDDELIEGTIAFDEIGYAADSRQSGSVKNRLITGFIRQLRHSQLNLFYTAFSYWRVDSRLRDETDFIVECEDLSNSSWGEDIGCTDGVFIIQRWYDLTGKMTRGKCVSPYYPKDKIPYKTDQFEALPFWFCYDTRKSQGLEEAFSKVKLDLYTKVSNRGNSEDTYIEQEAVIASKVAELEDRNVDIVTPAEFAQMVDEMGLPNNKTTRNKFARKGLSYNYHVLGYVLQRESEGGSVSA